MATVVYPDNSFMQGASLFGQGVGDLADEILYQKQLPVLQQIMQGYGANGPQTGYELAQAAIGAGITSPKLIQETLRYAQTLPTQPRMEPWSQTIVDPDTGESWQRRVNVPVGTPAEKVAEMLGTGPDKEGNVREKPVPGIQLKTDKGQMVEVWREENGEYVPGQMSKWKYESLSPEEKKKYLRKDIEVKQRTDKEGRKVLVDMRPGKKNKVVDYISEYQPGQPHKSMVDYRVQQMVIRNIEMVLEKYKGTQGMTFDPKTGNYTMPGSSTSKYGHLRQQAAEGNMAAQVDKKLVDDWYKQLRGFPETSTSNTSNTDPFEFF